MLMKFRISLEKLKVQEYLACIDVDYERRYIILSFDNVR